MKKINWKIFNADLWIEVLLSCILPFKVVDNFEYKLGYPISFISIYDTEIGTNSLKSMSINPILGFYYLSYHNVYCKIILQS